MATVYERSGKGKRGFWYVSYCELTAKGRRRRTKRTETRDKAAAERIANKLEADAALRRDGVIDPALEAIARESQRTIESHLEECETSQE